MSAQPVDIRFDSGATGRIWEIRTGLFGWAHPNGSEGQSESFRGAEDALEAILALPSDFTSPEVYWHESRDIARLVLAKHRPA